MSLHKSLRGADVLGGVRNVLKKIERIKRLIKQGLWEDGKIYNLPKVKIVKLKKIKEEKKPEENKLNDH